MGEDPNGWGEYKLLVLENQKELKECLDKLADNVHSLELTVEGIKVRTSIWGTIGGVVGGALAAATMQKFLK